MDTPAPIAVTPGDRVLVTGATGYIGGRLVPRLLEAGYEVVCVARDPAKVHGRPWAEHARVTILGCDVADVDGLVRAMAGCRAAYYLVHSMIAAGHDYGERDRELARGFAEAASRAGVARIVYLGGLGETGDHLSEHLSSRREIERLLAGAGVPVTVLRAAMIIGSGSASFEILRYLVDRLPVMITPRWVRTRCQPIAVRNVLHYLVAVLGTPATTGRERLRYGDALDFWRVAGVEPDRRLLLLAEMRLPGEAWLEFRIEPDGDRTRLTQTARFRSRGLLGLLYWYAVTPFHGIVFRGMLHGIRRFAESVPRTG